MSDTKALIDAASRLRRAGDPFLVATVVRVRGSAYRRPGARMLLTADRWIAGSVSGGCLEGDIIKKGWWRTREGSPVIVTYDATADGEMTWGFGLGCDGAIDVLIERAAADSPVDPLAFLASSVAAQARGALATVLGDPWGRVAVGKRVGQSAGGAIASDVDDDAVRAELAGLCRAAIEDGATRSALVGVDGREIEALVEAVVPPPRLFVFGTGHDAVPVVSFAKALGWEVFVCEPRPRLITRERFAAADAILVATEDEIASRIDASDCALAVVMAHDYERDRATLDVLLRTRAKYVGMLGPRRRTSRMLGELERSQGDPRIHAPVGLELGAETPQEIALAIIAEVQSVLASASGARLRDCPGSIHARAVRADAAE